MVGLLALLLPSGLDSGCLDQSGWKGFNVESQASRQTEVAPRFRQAPTSAIAHFRSDYGTEPTFSRFGVVVNGTRKSLHVSAAPQSEAEPVP